MTVSSQFSEGSSVQMPFIVTSEQMALYLSLSGDDNPLHTDDNAVQNSHFKKRVVYGGLLVSVISRLLGTKIPGHGCVWHSLSINFRRPLYIGEPAQAVATVTYANLETRILQLKIEIFKGQELIADGKAQAALPSTGGSN